MGARVFELTQLDGGQNIIDGNIIASNASSCWATLPENSTMKAQKDTDASSGGPTVPNNKRLWREERGQTRRGRRGAGKFGALRFIAAKWEPDARRPLQWFPVAGRPICLVDPSYMVVAGTTVGRHIGLESLVDSGPSSWSKKSSSSRDTWGEKIEEHWKVAQGKERGQKPNEAPSEGVGGDYSVRDSERASIPPAKVVVGMYLPLAPKGRVETRAKSKVQAGFLGTGAEMHEDDDVSRVAHKPTNILHIMQPHHGHLAEVIPTQKRLRTPLLLDCKPWGAGSMLSHTMGRRAVRSKTREDRAGARSQSWLPACDGKYINLGSKFRRFDNNNHNHNPFGRSGNKPKGRIAGIETHGRIATRPLEPFRSGSGTGSVSPAHLPSTSRWMPATARTAQDPPSTDLDEIISLVSSNNSYCGWNTTAFDNDAGKITQ